MSRAFILGAGFSKAIGPKMPTLAELSKGAIRWDKLPVNDPVYRFFEDDIEQLLTFLHGGMPWRTAAERHYDEATFIHITEQITYYINECEHKTLQRGVPAWLTTFVKYWHRTIHPVATMNYDTILEQVIGQQDSTIKVGELYPAPIAPIEHRTRSVRGSRRFLRPLVYKLHGSVNWWWPGDEAGVNQQVYFSQPNIFVERDAKGASTLGVRLKHIVEEGSNRDDLVPLIIPPIADKGAFYRSPFVRTIWSGFQTAINTGVRDVFCIGYSLPKTDITMRAYLAAAIAPLIDKVYIVNTATGSAANELTRNYEEVFGIDKVDRTYLGTLECVEKMVADRLEPELRQPLRKIPRRSS